MGKKKLKECLVLRERCKGCGICIAFCARNVLELDERDKARAVRPQDCVVCGLCEMRCPDLAIELIADEEGERKLG